MSRSVVWDEPPTLGPSEIVTRRGTVRVRRGRFAGGVSEGVEIVELDSGVTKVYVLPTRGMGVWRLVSRGVDFGWRSPVEGPVHPRWVPIEDASGLGWLEGFDELLVRCGLESNGAVDRDATGHVRHPLHGRIANLPAEALHLEVDEERGRVTLVGEVLEARFLFKRLRLRSAITVTAGESAVELRDDVINERAVPATARLLYHINVGLPLVGDGARILASPAWLEPKDDRSRAELDLWSHVGPPEPGYVERVYFSMLERDHRGWVHALLKAADGRAGFGVRADAATLPYFTFWKNTTAIADGYVIGLEPGTNLPRTRSEEEAAGRIVSLAPGQSATFQLELCPLAGETEVDAFEAALSGR